MLLNFEDNNFFKYEEQNHVKYNKILVTAIAHLTKHGLHHISYN